MTQNWRMWMIVALIPLAFLAGYAGGVKRQKPAVPESDYLISVLNGPCPEDKPFWSQMGSSRDGPRRDEYRFRDEADCKKAYDDATQALLPHVRADKLSGR